MINQEKLNAIYEKIKTPYKYGAVIQKTGYYLDSPVVFRHDDVFYMTCVEIDDKCITGYKTVLFRSDNLLDWQEVGYILTGHNDWDCAQTGGYAQLIDNAFGGSNEMRRLGNKYLFAYLGGSRTGYETDPLWMGLATCTDIADISTYHKIAKPILTTLDSDCRAEEAATLYKADMFIDEKRTLGYEYVCAYNAKRVDGRESIFLAVSDDGFNWKRYLDRAIISASECEPSIRINGDPQIVVIDGMYVMLYFIYDEVRNKAWNTFAVSEDLVHWAKWNGAPLVQSEFDWENVYAHKQWVLSYDGIVYHFYCAVNDCNERFVALATSQKID